MKQKISVDYWLILAILSLIALGIAIIYSDSPDWIRVRHPDNKDVYNFFIKYTIMSVTGLCIMIGTAFVPLSIWRKLTPILFRIGLGLCFLVITRIPGITETHNGATRWLNFGFEFQPSEFLKIAFILMLALRLEALQANYGSQGGVLDLQGLKGPLTLWGTCILLLILQPNLSMCIMLTTIFLGMIYYGGANGKHIMGTLGAAAIGAILFISYVPYAHRRWEAFVGGDEVAKGIGLQQKSSLLVMGHGGVFGQGLGGGTQKLGFLPEPFSDMAYATLGEDLGLIGTTFVMGVLGFIVLRGLKISKEAPENFARFAALGFTLNIAANTLLHIGVCTRSMIPTGQPLPLISNGGTNMLMSMFALGILLSLSMKRTDVLVKKERS